MEEEMESLGSRQLRSPHHSSRRTQSNVDGSRVDDNKKQRRIHIPLTNVPIRFYPYPVDSSLLLRAITMQDGRVFHPDGVLTGKSRKKKSMPQYSSMNYMQGEAEVQPAMLRPQYMQQNGNVRSEASLSFQQADGSNSDSFADSSKSNNGYRALRRKYLLLEEESYSMRSELTEVEMDVKKLEDMKSSLLDQLLVLEGLVDPSELRQVGKL